MDQNPINKIYIKNSQMFNNHLIFADKIGSLWKNYYNLRHTKYQINYHKDSIQTQDIQNYYWNWSKNFISLFKTYQNN